MDADSGFANYTLRELIEDRDAAIIRRNREQKLIDELESHIEAKSLKPQSGAKEMPIETPVEASTAA